MSSKVNLPAPHITCSNAIVGQECHPNGTDAPEGTITTWYHNNTIPLIYFQTQEKFDELQDMLNNCYQKEEDAKNQNNYNIIYI